MFATRKWKSLTPESDLKRIAAWPWLHRYFAATPGTVKLGAARLSTLVPSIRIMERKSSGKIVATFGNQRWAYMGWPLVRLGTFDDQEVFGFDVGPDAQILVDHILELDDYVILPHKCRSPLFLKHKLFARFQDCGIVFQQTGPRIPLSRYSLENKVDMSADDIKWFASFLGGCDTLASDPTPEEALRHIAGQLIGDDESGCKAFLDAALAPDIQAEPAWIDPVCEQLFGELPDGCQQEFAELGQDISSRGVSMHLMAKVYLTPKAYTE